MLTFDLRKEWRLIFQCMIDHLPMNAKEEHLRYWPSGGRDLFPSSATGFEPLYAHLSPPRCLNYMLTGFVRCLVDREISRGARKLVWTPM